MDLSDDFYKQWKTRTNNHQLFVEKSDFSIGKLENDKIFSSTALEDQGESESFSLRLSESCIEETEESSEKRSQPKQVNEVILISDSSADESIFSCDKAKKLTNNNCAKTLTRKAIYIAESSDDEPHKTPVHTSVKRVEKTSLISRTLVKEDDKRQIIIEESDSEIEQSEVPHIIKETVAESVTLSERKKKEILKWLSNNYDGSRSASSCSQESAIPNSRTSGISSGDSSLERLEQQYETPNNRGKLSRPSTLKKSNKNVQSNLERQRKIDQYFTTSKKGQLEIVKNRTPCASDSDRTPTNIKKFNPKRIIIPESESLDSNVTNNRSSNKIIESNIQKNIKDIVIPESLSCTSKSINGTSTDGTPSDIIPKNSKRIIIPESESFDSRTSKNNNYKMSDKKYSDNTPTDMIKSNFRKVIIPESESFESKDSEDIFDKLSDTNCKVANTKILVQQTPVVIPESLEITEDLDPLSSSLTDLNLKNKNSKQNNQNSEHNITNDTTINECADILENLYGATWRNQASALICVTEPKKQTTKKIFNEIQTEKKITFRKPIFNNDSDSESSDRENGYNIPKKSQTTTKKSKIKFRTKNSFINDESTTESSPDCSYYTALTNPVSQNNPSKTETASTIKTSEKKVLAICDSESDVDNQNWRTKGKNQRKLSFDSSTSTSEFDPEDVVPPKSVTKTLKLKKSIIIESTKKKIIQKPQKEIKKSFVASLSKDVPLKNADFKAMTYRVKYDTLKEELCRDLYKLFNEKVFDSQLPEDMSIEWSVRLRGTAGKCYNKESLKALGKTVRSSRIVLASKVLDSPDRLRDTLIHEMCHAATWLINNVSDGHGSFWKAWANKAMKAFPELPPISRCHDYDVQTKYTYKCTSCGYSIGRHSKSLDLNRKRCGYCHGKFELLINKVKKDGTKSQKKSTAKTKEPSGFALYVKENYHSVKKSGAATKHGDVMKILGQQFSAVKLTPKPENRIRNNENESP